MKNVLSGFDRWWFEVENRLGLAHRPVLGRADICLARLKLAGAAIQVARVAGISPDYHWASLAGRPSPLVGMLTYSVAVTFLLAYIGFAGSAGVLLWPAIVLHAVLSVLLGFDWTTRKPR